MIPFLSLSTAQQPMVNEHDERQYQQQKNDTASPSRASLHDKPSFHDFIHDTFHDPFSIILVFLFRTSLLFIIKHVGLFHLCFFFFAVLFLPPFFGVVLLFYCSRFWTGKGKGGMGCSIIHYLVRGIVVGWTQELFFILFPFLAQNRKTGSGKKVRI